MAEGTRYLIVGHGAAGLAAARTIRARDDTGAITILTDEPHRFYSRPGLAYLLSGDIPERQLYSVPDELYRRLHIGVRVGSVAAIHRHERVVSTQQGQQVAYDILLLATGAEAARPKLPGIDLEGVVTLDNLADARHILKQSRRARSAVVVGGGITALELAEGLAARGLKVHYLLRKDRYWASVLDPDESKRVESGLGHEGIQIHHRTEVQEIIGRRGRVKGVLTKDGQRIGCQIVAVAIGIRPRIALAVQAGLETERGIIVDEYLRTSDPFVFAAGDVAQVYDPMSGSYRLDSLWWSADEQGRCAGENMAGGAKPYLRSAPFNVTRIGGLVTTIVGYIGGAEKDADLVGIMRGDSESWRDDIKSLVVQDAHNGTRLRLMVGEETLLGAVVMGDQSLSRVLQHLVREQIPLSGLRSMLLSNPQRAVAILHKADPEGWLNPAQMEAA
ncbi:MAG: FAD-dependent oxidoreductase [Anaerolineales bacterium]|jgi:NAD(P)H-nitrite reductase large subunit